MKMRDKKKRMRTKGKGRFRLPSGELKKVSRFLLDGAGTAQGGTYPEHQGRSHG